MHATSAALSPVLNRQGNNSVQRDNDILRQLRAAAKKVEDDPRQRELLIIAQGAGAYELLGWTRRPGDPSPV